MKPISGKNLVKTLSKHGWQIKNQSGSHIVLGKGQLNLSIPNHKEVSFGVQNQILNKAGLSKKDIYK